MLKKQAIFLTFLKRLIILLLHLIFFDQKDIQIRYFIVFILITKVNLVFTEFKINRICLPKNLCIISAVHLFFLHKQDHLKEKTPIQ